MTGWSVPSLRRRAVNAVPRVRACAGR
jgi:hypothetical protein